MSWPSVIILVPAKECEPLIARFRDLGTRWNSEENAEALEWRGYSYSLDFSGRVLADFDPEEVRELSLKIGELCAIYLSCESMAAARALLSVVLEGRTGLLDTNHDDILDFNRFIRLIKEHPEWDWRRMSAAEFLSENHGGETHEETR
ncbi:hypothetical protein ACWGI9_24460 [Streptomyces sp. NPDC054833]